MLDWLKAHRVHVMVVLASILAGIVLIIGGLWAYNTFFGNSDAGNDSRNRWFVCSETGKPFQAKLDVGMEIPVYSSYSHKKTGYLAEMCGWTADGKIRSKPVPVLMNTHRGEAEPTFCPDCNRLVTFHNPPAVEGNAPPPTREEYANHHGSQH